MAAIPREIHVGATDRLRILLVLEAAGGGAGHHVIDLAAGLQRLGHAVHLAYSTQREEADFRDHARRLTGVALHHTDMRRAPGWRDLAAMLQLRRLMRSAGPFDIVHGHSSKGGALARMAAIRTGVVTLYTPHAFITLQPELGRLSRFWYATAERALARMGDGMICVSEEERDHALQLGIPAEHIFLVHNGLAPSPPGDRVRARQMLGLRDGDVCAGFVGRLSPQKAADRLVRAFALAAREQPALRLVIVGSGPETDALRSLVAELDLRGRVLLAGQGDGPALMAGFDMLAVTSRYEGFPYVFLEAAERGLPLVTMAVGGCRAVVRHGVNGYVVPQGETVVFARHLAALAGQAELRNAMGRASRLIAREFTVERMVRETGQVYARLLTRRAGHRAQ